MWEQSLRAVRLLELGGPNMQPRTQRRAQGSIPFLVAIALSAATVVSVEPIIHAGREFSTKENSLNNLRTLAGAVRAYTMDYDGYLPGWVNNNPNGLAVYAHNTWDQQIRPYVNSDDVYTDGGTGIRSYSQPRFHDRVITYGLNALLITPPQRVYTGTANFAEVSNNPPKTMTLQIIPNPANKILLAELSTRQPMNYAYGQRPDPIPFTFTGKLTSDDWAAAWDGWIDVSPRPFVENTASFSCYVPPYAGGARDRGIARDLYDGGGCYAFCDGHVEFLSIRDSVGLGKLVGTTTITTSNCWAAGNTANLWNPQVYPKK